MIKGISNKQFTFCDWHITRYSSGIPWLAACFTRETERKKRETDINLEANIPAKVSLNRDLTTTANANHTPREYCEILTPIFQPWKYHSNSLQARACSKSENSRRVPTSGRVWILQDGDDDAAGRPNRFLKVPVSTPPLPLERVIREKIEGGAARVRFPPLKPLRREQRPKLRGGGGGRERKK